LTTSLDTNYDPNEQWLGFDELLSVTNLFFSNETEAKSLTHAADINAAAEALRGKTEIVAIKLGAQGALGIRGADTVKVDSIPVPVADTVGAGDSFAAGSKEFGGYISGWIENHSAA
jgi:ribokinase